MLPGQKILKILRNQSKELLITLLVLFILSLNLTSSRAFGAENTSSVNTIAVFVRDGCQHCREEEEFLEKIIKERTDIKIQYFRLENSNDKKIWNSFTERLHIAKVTPITVFGNKYIIGFDSENSTGKEILTLINDKKIAAISTDINNPAITSAGQTDKNCSGYDRTPCAIDTKPSYFITLPIIGKIDAQAYPLIVLSSILGFFDGFNPCAMWVLVTFLIILIEVGNRRKMFVFAGIFILAEALMYTLILTVWYQTWDFVKLDSIVTPIVGAVSVIGGFLFLKEWRKKELECKVTDISKRAQTKAKIQALATDKFTIFTFLGILGIAFSVNIIEFACSIGIPQAFTKILELNHLSFFQSSLMIAVYIFFYMLDDFAVFGLALWSADKLHLTTRYSKLSNLVGGIIMVIIGLLLIFKPQFLQF